MRSDPIVIGPVGAGKTTVSALLAEALDVPHIRMDSLRLGYYAELGYDDEVRKRLFEAEGWRAVDRYWKVFDPHSVERLLEEHTGVLDMGGGSLICAYEDQLERMRRAFESFPNVVMLVPCPDIERAVAILAEQKGRVMDFNREFLHNRSLWELAKITVYTEGLTPEEVCAEVLQRIVR